MNINQGFGNPTEPSATETWRFVESPTWQVGAFGGQGILMYQHDSTTGQSKDAWTLGGRGSYAISKNVKMLAELGYSQINPANFPQENLTKITIAPALSTGPDFWKRPELRLYMTWASFNHAAANDPANGL